MPYAIPNFNQDVFGLASRFLSNPSSFNVGHYAPDANGGLQQENYGNYFDYFMQNPNAQQMIVPSYYQDTYSNPIPAGDLPAFQDMSQSQWTRLSTRYPDAYRWLVENVLSKPSIYEKYKQYSPDQIPMQLVKNVPSTVSVNRSELGSGNNINKNTYDWIKYWQNLAPNIKSSLTSPSDNYQSAQSKLSSIYNSFSNVVGQGQSQNYLNWLGRQQNKYTNQFETAGLSDPSQYNSFASFLTGTNPNTDFEFSSFFDKQERPNVFAPSMRFQR